MRALLFGAALVAAPVAASPAKLLVGSSPATGAVLEGPVDTLTLDFAKRVELRRLAITLPDDRAQDVVAGNYAPGARHAKGKAFAYTLNPPLTAPGRYEISYLIVGHGVPSLDGRITFDIEAN